MRNPSYGKYKNEIKIEGEVTIKYKIINLSSQHVLVSRAAEQVKREVEGEMKHVGYVFFSGKSGNYRASFNAGGERIPNDKVNYTEIQTNFTKINIDFEEVNSLDDLEHDDWVAVIVDNIPKDSDGFDAAGVANDHVYLVESFHAISNSSALFNVGSHEMFHNLSLDDRYKKNPDGSTSLKDPDESPNMMQGANRGSGLLGWQKNTVIHYLREFMMEENIRKKHTEKKHTHDTHAKDRVKNLIKRQNAKTKDN